MIRCFLAAGQQVIAVIKPPFDFICSDSMEHDRTAQKDNQPFPSYSMRKIMPSGGFTGLLAAIRGLTKLLGTITLSFHMHYQ